MFLHRVGEKRLQHSPFVVIPPHALLSPPPVATRLLPACYPRYPFRNTVCAIDAIDGIDPDGVFIIFSPRAIFLSSIPTFFHFSPGKYGIYAIYGTALCFEPKFDRRVKNKVWHKVWHSALDLWHAIPRKCVQSSVKTGADGAVA